MRIEFTSRDIDQLRNERFNHPDPRVRSKMEALYLKAQDFSDEEICLLVRISKDDLFRTLEEYRYGGIGALKTISFDSYQSDLNENKRKKKIHFGEVPPRMVVMPRSRLNTVQA